MGSEHLLVVAVPASPEPAHVCSFAQGGGAQLQVAPGDARSAFRMQSPPVLRQLWTPGRALFILLEMTVAVMTKRTVTLIPPGSAL